MPQTATALMTSQGGSAATIPALLFTDVDGTLLDGGPSRAEVAAGWNTFAGRVENVLVSGRTVDELLFLMAQMGVVADVIAENGACTAVHTPAVARALDARESIVRNGRRWYIATPGAPAAEVREAMCRAREETSAHVRLAAELPRRRRSEMLGRNRHRTRLALDRRCSVLTEPPVADSAALAWLETLRDAGFHATVGSRWLSVWRGPDRGEAVQAYLAARAEAGCLPPTVAAIGDTANDTDLLRAVPRRFVVRRPNGEYEPALLAVPGVVRLCASGHAGWRRAATLVSGGVAVPVVEAS